MYHSVQFQSHEVQELMIEVRIVVPLSREWEKELLNGKEHVEILWRNIDVQPIDLCGIT